MSPAVDTLRNLVPSRSKSDPSKPRSKYWIDDWRPEDPVFWKDPGAAIAKRNLTFSVLSEHIGFSVWSMWSVIVLFMGPEWGIDPAGKFLLTALPTLAGAALRLPYTFAVATFGGRNWTIVSALLLLIPTTLIAIFLVPGTSYTTLLIVATFAGGFSLLAVLFMNWWYIF